MAYIPRERLLIQADAFHPRPGAKPLPAPSLYTTNLVENVERLKLDVARVVHVHGGTHRMADVLKAAGRSRRTVGRLRCAYPRRLARFQLVR